MFQNGDETAQSLVRFELGFRINKVDLDNKIACISWSYYTIKKCMGFFFITICDWESA